MYIINPLFWSAIYTYTYPTSPQNFELSQDGNNIILNWNAPIDTGGMIIIGYTIQKGETENSLTDLVILPGSTFEFIDISVELGLTYYYSIAASNDIGEGVTSEILSITVSDITDETSDTSDTSDITDITDTTDPTDTPVIDLGFGSVFYIGLVLVSIGITRRKKYKF